MKRKPFALLAAGMLAGALLPVPSRAADESGDRHQIHFERVIERVRIAFETRESCRNLFSKYHGDSRKALDRARFIYVGDALEPLGFAAATIIGTNQTLIGAGFYQDTADLDGMATVLIHELLHQQGAGAEIDNYIENYQLISESCGTRNAAR